MAAGSTSNFVQQQVVSLYPGFHKVKFILREEGRLLREKHTTTHQVKYIMDPGGI